MQSHHRLARVPYYLRPDGKVGHDAFAVIRETIREMNKVAIGRVVLTNAEVEALEKRSRAEDDRWEKERERLQAAVRRARD